MLTNDRAAALHNSLAGEIATRIVKEPLAAGGTVADVMVLTESVVVGVALACIRLGGDEAVLSIMFEAAKQRLAKIRLGNIDVAGRG